MPIIKSAKKRVRTAVKAAIRNSKVRRNMRVTTKNFNESFSSKDISAAVSAIDIAVKRGVIHKNKAARKKAQLAAIGKKNGTKLVKADKKTAVKPVAKKVTNKKPVAKKSVAKKTTKK